MPHDSIRLVLTKKPQIKYRYEKALSVDAIIEKRIVRAYLFQNSIMNGILLMIR